VEVDINLIQSIQGLLHKVTHITLSQVLLNPFPHHMDNNRSMLISFNPLLYNKFNTLNS
jgi:hypothetical protein